MPYVLGGFEVCERPAPATRQAAAAVALARPEQATDVDTRNAAIRAARERLARPDTRCRPAEHRRTHTGLILGVSYFVAG